MPINDKNIIRDFDATPLMRRSIAADRRELVRLPLMMLKRPITQPAVRDHYASPLEEAADGQHRGSAIRSEWPSWLLHKAFVSN